MGWQVSSMSFRRSLLETTALGLSSLAGVAMATGTAGPALAEPSGGRVVAGSAEISQQGAVTTIDQSSRRAVIDWQSFDIDAGELTSVNQPDAGSVSLNRVTGGSGPSALRGRLESNGNVWLVNPRGVMIGAGAEIDAAGFLATTADIDNSDFMEGRDEFRFPSPHPDARIVNAGTITVAERGLAALVAPGVENSGLIQGQLAQVVVAGTQTFALDFYGDGLVQFEATGTVSQAPEGADALVSNSGTIHAPGGSVLMTADAASDVIDSVINMDGFVEARSVSQQGGTIVLSGGGNGDVMVSGILDAAGPAAGQQGGTVEVLGERVALLDGARIDASGDAGGGRVNVGGSRQGGGPLPNAKRVHMAPAAAIAADATGAGDGGSVVLWSDAGTWFGGTISARGGPDGGNGGFVETSSATGLQAMGAVDAGANAGEAGTWLIDPVNVRIIFPDPDNPISETPPVLFGAPPDDAVVSPVSINEAPSDVVVQAVQDIFIEAPIAMSQAGVGLVFQAGRNIRVNAPISTLDGPVHLEANSPHVDPQLATGEIVFFEGADIATGVGSVTLIFDILREEGSFTIQNTSPGLLAIGPSQTGQSLDVLGALETFFNVDIFSAGFVTTAGPDGTGPGGLTFRSEAITIQQSIGFDTILLNAIDEITQQPGASLTATGLALTADGNVTLDENNFVDLLAADVGGNLTFRDGNDLTFGNVGGVSGVSVEGDAIIRVAGALSQNAGSVIEAGIFRVEVFGSAFDEDIRLEESNDVDAIELAEVGDYAGAIDRLEFNDVDDLNVGGGGPAWDLGSVQIVAAGPLVLQQDIATAADPDRPGSANIVLVTGEAFDAQGNALTASGGRVLVYSVDPERDDRGNIPGDKRYDRTFQTDPPATIEPGVTFLYSIAPELTVSGPILSRLYGEDNPPLEPVAISGFIDGDTAETATTGAPALSTDAAIGSDAGDYLIFVEQGTLQSQLGYGFNLENGNLAVEPAPLTVSVEDTSREYGLPNPDFTAVFAGFRLDDGPSVVGDLGFETDAEPGSDVGSYAVFPVGGSAQNYAIVERVPGELLVTVAPLIVMANDAQRFVGQANPPFSATLSGLRADDPPSVVSGLSFSTPAVRTSPPGQFPIEVEGGIAENYVIVEREPGELSVLPNPELGNALAEGAVVSEAGDGTGSAARLEIGDWRSLAAPEPVSRAFITGGRYQDDPGDEEWLENLRGD